MDNEFEMLDKMTSNQQLALTLRNCTDIPANDHLIINEGIVSAINALAHMDDASIRRCCAVAYYHLASRPANHDALLHNGVCAGVVTLTMQVQGASTNIATIATIASFLLVLSSSSLLNCRVCSQALLLLLYVLYASRKVQAYTKQPIERLFST